VIGQQIAGDQLLTRPSQLQRLQLEQPAQGGIGVITQSLGVGHSHQHQIQRPGGGLAVAQEVLPHQPLINPTKLRRHLA
jgi:hypothetical protein